MSRFVDEIIQDIQASPESWRPIDGVLTGLFGIRKGCIEISKVGNTRVTSILSIRKGDNDYPTTYMDRWNLEVTVVKWWRNASLQMITEK